MCTWGWKTENTEQPIVNDVEICLKSLYDRQISVIYLFSVTPEGGGGREV